MNRQFGEMTINTFYVSSLFTFFQNFIKIPRVEFEKSVIFIFPKILYYLENKFRMPPDMNLNLYKNRSTCLGCREPNLTKSHFLSRGLSKRKKFYSKNSKLISLPPTWHQQNYFRYENFIFFSNSNKKTFVWNLLQFELHFVCERESFVCLGTPFGKIII